MMQLFKTCTVHKLTHLFSSDVLTTTERPRHWNTWDSQLCKDFTKMINLVLINTTNSNNSSRYSTQIAAIPTKSGGLGLQHPISTAIPFFMMTTKRNIQHCIEGVWIDNTSSLVTISPAVAKLHTTWKTSTSPTFQTFRKYCQDMRDLCVSDKVEKREIFFILKSSSNICKD